MTGHRMDQKGRWEQEINSDGRLDTPIQSHFTVILAAHLLSRQSFSGQNPNGIPQQSPGLRGTSYPG